MYNLQAYVMRYCPFYAYFSKPATPQAKHCSKSRTTIQQVQQPWLQVSAEAGIEVVVLVNELANRKASEASSVAETAYPEAMHVRRGLLWMEIGSRRQPLHDALASTPAHR